LLRNSSNDADCQCAEGSEATVPTDGFTIDFDDVVNESASTAGTTGVNCNTSNDAGRHQLNPGRKRDITFGTANAKFLCTQDLAKIDGLASLLETLHFPDLFLVTELGRAAGMNSID